MGYYSITLGNKIDKLKLLPAGVAGRTYIISDEHGSGLGRINVKPDGSEKINGSSTYSMNSAYQSVTVVFNSNSWHII